MKKWPFVVGGVATAIGAAYWLWPRKWRVERRLLRAIAAPTFDRNEYISATGDLIHDADRQASYGFLQAHDEAAAAGETTSPEQRIRTFMFLIDGIENRGDPRAPTLRTNAYYNAAIAEGLRSYVTEKALP